MKLSDIKKMRKFHDRSHHCGGYDPDFPDRDIWFYDDIKCDVIKALDALEKTVG